MEKSCGIEVVTPWALEEDWLGLGSKLLRKKFLPYVYVLACHAHSSIIVIFFILGDMVDKQTLRFYDFSFDQKLNHSGIRDPTWLQALLKLAEHPSLQIFPSPRGKCHITFLY